MDIFSVLALCGGIAVFLYGMTLMGESLEKSAGSSLKGFLEKVTSNPFKAVLLGLCVTSIIQSSTATTVMVVGFVNSGIMELSQSIGVIMGANIGTTVTAWLLSLTGIESGNPFIQMLNAKNLAYIVSVVGIVMFMMSSNSRKKDIGSIFIGFSLVIIGMELMSDSVAPLAEVPEFTNILTLFTNPILGILMGAVLTAVFSLLASVCGTLVRSPYLAALALCLVCFGGLGLVSVLGELGWWAAYLIACFQPVTVWLSCSAWFTELGLNAVLPWQETIASGLNLLLLGGGVLLALGWFDRKDVS